MNSNTSTRGIRISWRLCPASPCDEGGLSAPSADFSDDDIEDRRIEEEEDLEDASPAARSLKDGEGSAGCGAATRCRPAVESPRVVCTEGPAQAEALPEAAESEREAQECRRGQGKLVRAYFSVVRKTFCDLVPKIVMTHVVHKVEEKMQATLVGRVAGAEHAALLEEDAATAQERRRDGSGARRPARRLAQGYSTTSSTRRRPCGTRGARGLARGRLEPAPCVCTNNAVCGGVTGRRATRAPLAVEDAAAEGCIISGLVAARGERPRAGGADPQFPFSPSGGRLLLPPEVRGATNFAPSRASSSGATWTTFVFSNSSSAIIAPKRLKYTMTTIM